MNEDSVVRVLNMYFYMLQYSVGHTSTIFKIDIGTTTIRKMEWDEHHSDETPA
jgi:hypothetical protein